MVNDDQLNLQDQYLDTWNPSRDAHIKVTGMLVGKFKLLVNLLYMWVWLKLQLTPKGDFCVASVCAFFFKFLNAQY